MSFLDLSHSVYPADVASGPVGRNGVHELAAVDAPLFELLIDENAISVKAFWDRYAALLDPFFGVLVGEHVSPDNPKAQFCVYAVFC